MKTAPRILAVTVLLIATIASIARADNSNLVTSADDQFVKVQSASNLKKLGLALMMYLDDNQNKFPNLTNAESMKKALTYNLPSGSENVFVHPKSGKPYQPNPSLSGKSAKGTNVVGEVVIYEPDPSEDGTRAVLFGDAHVERVTEARWQDLKKSSQIP